MPVAILNHITVVECSTFVTGPYTTALLADLGARVIKIESVPQGDPYRYFAPDPFFCFNVAEVLDAAQVKHLDLVEKIEHPLAGALRFVGGPVRYDGLDKAPSVPPPPVGEHGRKILHEPGYDSDAVSDLPSRGVTKAL